MLRCKKLFFQDEQTSTRYKMFSGRVQRSWKNIWMKFFFCRNNLFELLGLNWNISNPDNKSCPKYIIIITPELVMKLVQSYREKLEKLHWNYFSVTIVYFVQISPYSSRIFIMDPDFCLLGNKLNLIRKPGNLTIYISIQWHII